MSHSGVFSPGPEGQVQFSFCPCPNTWLKSVHSYTDITEEKCHAQLKKLCSYASLIWGDRVDNKQFQLKAYNVPRNDMLQWLQLRANC